MSKLKNRRNFSLKNVNTALVVAVLTLIVATLTLIASVTIPEIRQFLGLGESATENPLDDEAELCKANIVVSTAEGSALNQIKMLPRRDAPSRPPATQGATVIVDEQLGTGWTRISYTSSNANHEGWIQDRYLEFSSGCS